MILEMKEKTFVNEYGFKEKHTTKTIELELSGHLYRGSAFETSDNCGNCDGANCHRCCNIWTVIKYSDPIMTDDGYYELKVVKRKIFYNEDEAMSFYKKL